MPCWKSILFRILWCNQHHFRAFLIVRRKWKKSLKRPQFPEILLTVLGHNQIIDEFDEI